MKTNIESAANLIVILVAVVVASVFLKDRFFSPAPSEPDAVKAGDKLANLGGWNWGEHDQTLVLALRKSCHFCENSVPFLPEAYLSARRRRFEQFVRHSICGARYAGEQRVVWPS